MGLQNNLTEKIREVESYFELLDFLDDTLTTMTIVQENDTDKNFRINTELSKVMKANCYLMLYNLVEGTVNESLNFIFSEISTQKIHKDNLKPLYKKIWIDYKANLVKLVETNKSAFPNTNQSDILEQIDTFEIIDYVEKKEDGKTYFAYDAYIKTINRKDISGNLDVRHIRETLSTKYGFSHTPYDPHEVYSEHLVVVKNVRNKLAHGEERFSEIGGRKSLAELVEIKNSVFEYLKTIVVSIDKFLVDEDYKIA